MSGLHIKPPRQKGFVLPTILLIVLALMIIGLATLQSVSSIRSSLQDQYYTRLAKQAAEAGTVSANFCLTTNSFIQTWGPDASKPNLTQGTDCTGTTRSPAVTTLLPGGNVRSTFEVGDLEVRNDGAIVIASTGTVDIMRGSSTEVARSYTFVLKQLVDWNTFVASASASGTAKTCAIVNKQLYCWGANSNGGEPFGGQLGDGTFDDSLVPVKVIQDVGVLAGKVVDDVFSAQFHNCALAAGSVYCWGYNSNGQLGDGTTTSSNVPVLAGGALAGKVVTAIGGSGNTSCAIAEGKIYCWGRNDKGTVGNDSTIDVTSPISVSTINLGPSYVATKLSTSGSRSFNMCAIVDGQAWCWGQNGAGQIGNGTVGADVRIPTKVDDSGILSGVTITSISQDGYYVSSPPEIYTHVCATGDGKVFCWGENGKGQLGQGNTNDTSVPARVNGALSSKFVQDVVVGLQHSCALANSRVYCWGGNNHGQLGDGKKGIDRSTPALVEEQPGALKDKIVTAIGGGANRGCAIADYRAYCWGYNAHGQLGDGTTVSKDVPTESIFLRPKAPSFVF